MMSRNIAASIAITGGSYNDSPDSLEFIQESIKILK